MKRHLLWIIPLLIVIGGVLLLSRGRRGSSGSVAGVLATPLSSPPTRPINKDILIHVQDKPNAPTLTYTLTDAQLLDEIIVKGQLAHAAPGRKFLVVDIKIKNDTQVGYTLNTRDFVRLQSSDGSDEWIAPDIHNDPVEVQAISTKATRIGFPVDANQKDMKLRLGEIKGDKTLVDVHF